MTRPTALVIDAVLCVVEAAFAPARKPATLTLTRHEQFEVDALDALTRAFAHKQIGAR